MTFKEIFEDIKYNNKGYQTGDGYTVYANSDSSGVTINVNQSAGWILSPHDDSLFELKDNGKTRASLRFKEGNIDKFAEKMYKLNDKSTHGETENLSSKDYADIIRVWIDMRKNKG